MHVHQHTSHQGPRLRLALLVTLAFALVELVGGLLSGSLALLGDAAHSLTDATALGLAALAAWVVLRPPSHRHSYGFGRAEVVAALINAMFMLAVIGGIGVEAIRRLSAPPDVSGGIVMAVAAAGMGVNGFVAWLLSRGRATLNTRAALLHVLADLLASGAALVAGTVIFVTGWTLIDPLLALAVCALILYSTVRLLRDSLNVVMEGVPRHLDLPTIGADLAGVENVRSVHDLHIWTLASGRIALSAHVVLSDLAQWEQTLNEINRLLQQRHGIDHTTLQPETSIPGAPLIRRPKPPAQ